MVSGQGPMPGLAVASKPGKPKPPSTTVINGTTYSYSGQRNPMLEQGRFEPGNSLYGADGSIWDPMPAPGGGGGGRGTGGGGGEDGYDIDLSKLWASIPQGPAPQVPVPPRQTGPGLEDRRRAESLQFGRAKDRVAKIGRGSMKSLENSFARRGLSGSSMEGAAIADTVGGMRGDLANVVTQQAQTALDREAQISDRDYAGGISQRGQDIGIETGNANRVVDAYNQQLNFLQMLAGLRARGARIY